MSIREVRKNEQMEKTTQTLQSQHENKYYFLS